MKSDNPKKDIPNNEEEHDDIYSLRANMDDMEDAPGTEDKNQGGLIKNIGKIFTRALPEIDEKGTRQLDEDALNEVSSPSVEESTETIPSENEERQDDIDLGILRNLAQNDESERIQDNPSTQSLLGMLSDDLEEETASIFNKPIDFENLPETPLRGISTQPLPDLNFDEEGDENITKPLPDIENEAFVETVTASLNEDLDILRDLASDGSASEERDKPIEESPFVTDDQVVQEIEEELESGERVENPFEMGNADLDDNDFISRLQEMFPDQPANAGAQTKPLNEDDPFTETLDEQSLSQSGWEEVLKATEEKNELSVTQDQHLLAGEVKDTDENLLEDVNSILPFDESEIPAIESAEDNSLDIEDFSLEESEKSSEDKVTPEDEQDLDTLRQSFIEEFEQSPWEKEEEKEPKTWFGRSWQKFTDWLNSLSTAERILMSLSLIISITVLIAIALVAFEWNSSRNTTAKPPEALQEVTDLDVYPTGLQLPGGWFFYLKKGQIDTSGKIGVWEPEGAEWLAGTTIRRVAAIPWSRQAEAVALSFEPGDEITLYMSNNESISYIFTEIKTVEYDNVRDTMIDTEPSLAVILYRDDQEDRYVIIARPK